MLREANCGALITSAGASSRMGEAKALVGWEGRPLIEHQASVLSGFADVVVVLGCDAEAIAAAAPLRPPARYVVHAAWQDGRSSSIEAGARALSATLDAVLVAAVDQPMRPATISAMLAAFDPTAMDVLQPSFAGRRGHPLLLSGRLLPALCRAQHYDQGLRGVVRTPGLRRADIAVDDPLVRANLNTPELLARWRE